MPHPQRQQLFPLIAEEVVFPFKEVDACLKCRFKGVNFHFCLGRSENGKHLCAGLHYEHLHRECRRCGYRWLMRCADDPQG